MSSASNQLPVGLTQPPFYKFPPFFTLQPVEATQSHQRTLWCKWILSYLQHTRQSKLSLISTTLASPLFTNHQFQPTKALNEVAARIMIQQLIDQEYGEWEGGSEGPRIHAHLSWKNIHTWADELYQWAEKHGQVGNITTLYELQQGDNTKGQDFWGLSEVILLRALENLVGRKRVALIRADIPSETGIKFLEL